MGVMLTVLLGLVGERYGIAPDLQTYPQSSPKETLASVVKAIENKRIDYLLAQLVNPDFVDRRVKLLTGKFEELVKEATGKLLDDKRTSKGFKQLLNEGVWETKDDGASVKLKDERDQGIFLRKIDNRWYMDNRKK